MKKVYLALAAVLAVCTLIFTGCNKQEVSNENEFSEEVESIVGTPEFISQISTIAPSLTKAGEFSEEEIAEMIAPVMQASLSYLTENGYNYEEDFESIEDPRIAWVALGLAEYDSMTKTTVGGCVLEALGVNEILKAGGKQLAKIIAKQALKKAIPYVGAALAVADFVACVAE